ncbi:MAG TPA: universal stress protein [Coleofasciculaceae cyanobacterium]|jgi:nucleotide-binding universal stress UspA family protein
MFDKILVAIDLSEINNSAFNTALSLAQSTGAKLMLLHIISPEPNNYPNPFIYSGFKSEPMNDSLWTIYQEQWEKFKQRRLETLRSLVKEAATTGVNAEFTQDFGDPRRTICDLAKTWSADLIVIGSRGLTGVKEIFLGSVSNYVTHHAPCSVLVLRETAKLNSESSQQATQLASFNP